MTAICLPCTSFSITAFWFKNIICFHVKYVSNPTWCGFLFSHYWLQIDMDFASLVAARSVYKSNPTKLSIQCQLLSRHIPILLALCILSVHSLFWYRPTLRRWSVRLFFYIMLCGYDFPPLICATPIVSSEHRPFCSWQSSTYIFKFFTIWRTSK